jgi:leukotriene-A4 hydrolase
MCHSHFKFLALSTLIGVFLNSCGNQPTEPMKHNHHHHSDPHSYAVPSEARITHLRWTAEVDFERKSINGKADYDIEMAAGAEKMVFDIAGLNVKAVKADGVPVDFKVGERHPEFGSPLVVWILGNTKRVEIEYETGEEAGALLWVEGDKPFLFTQSQAILARTWIPCQDSPGIRFTYEAQVTVPQGLLALMSAENPQTASQDGVHHFKMDQPIPSYLMALAVGDIRFREVGPRTGVYATPDLIDRAHYEFADMERMLEAAEGLYGAYAWGRYDLLILPPAFPFGGMENPRLTFATPTILAGDRSLVSLVAHELAHSWSGNLVTNATWNDFWLNEGFTVYFEQRIMEAVYGREHAEMLATLTLQGLLEEEEDIFAHHPEDTALKLDLEGRNPDDGLTVIAYDKGYFFLRLIEETVGRERFDAFLKGYFSKHSFQVMDTDSFLAYLRAHLLSKEEEQVVRVEEWVFGQRIPDNIPTVRSERLEMVDDWTEKWNNNKIRAHELPWESWLYQERYRFITNLKESGASNVKLKLLDEKFNITGTGNYEVLFAWLEKSIRNDYETAYLRVESFLIEVGRRKFLTPLYRAMKETGKLSMARAIYAKARPGYHAVTRQTMDELIGKPGQI